MAFIISYKKYIDEITTKTLNTPDGASELYTLNGTTYVSMPTDSELPADQPAQIADSIETVTLTDALRANIKAASPHCKLISKRVDEKIREAYSQEDENYFSRISIGVLTGQYVFEAGEEAAVTAFGDFVEAQRQWGRDQRAALGL